METKKIYNFAVHSPHFLYPISIKAEVSTVESWYEVLETISKEATQEWLKDYPEYFKNITAPQFYNSLSIIVSQEV